MKYLIIDVECYMGRVMVGILNDDTGKVTVLDGVKDIKQALTPCYKSKDIKWISFNGMRYDHKMLENILYGKENPYEFSQKLIHSDDTAPSWERNIVDLMVMIPSVQRCSLKELGHRLNYKTLANLPYAYDEMLSEDEWQDIIDYNLHDLKITQLLWKDLRGEYDARLALGSSFDFHAFYSGTPRLAERAMLSKISGKISDNDVIVKPDLPLSKESKERFDKIYKSLEIT